MSTQNLITTLQLTQLQPDQMQPRKYFDEKELQELSQNIKTNGILQPLLVTPFEDHYIIVCGERRFKASKLAGLTEVPVVVKEMTPQQMLEAQITENLMRSSMNAMEEAMAFLHLLEINKLDVEEIAHRIGKDARFVKQRLRLTDLVPKFKELVLHNKIRLKDAIRVSALDVMAQKLLYKEEVGDDNVEADNYFLKLHDIDFREVENDLNDAPFDIEDATLYKLAGACTLCQFNSNNALLFNEEKPTCGKPLCFKTKANLAFQKAVEEAATSTGVYYISRGYGKSDVEVKEFEAKTNNKVLKIWDDYNDASMPDKPELDDYDTTDPDYKEEYADDLKRYEDDLKEHQQDIASGKIVKAFVVSGSDKGKWTYIELKQKAAKQNSNTNDNSNDTASDTAKAMEQQISEAQYKLQRTKEIAENNIWEQFYKLFDVEQQKEVIKTTSGVKDDLLFEMAAASFYNKLNYSDQELFVEYFKYNTKPNAKNEISDFKLMQMLQFFVIATLPPLPTQITTGNTHRTNLCNRFVELNYPAAYAEVVEPIMEKANKKIAKLKDVISSLKDETKTTTKKKTVEA